VRVPRELGNRNRVDVGVPKCAVLGNICKRTVVGKLVAMFLKMIYWVKWRDYPYWVIIDSKAFVFYLSLVIRVKISI